MKSSNFNTVEENINFPKAEEEILEYWEKIDAFKTQLKKTEHFPKYTFYDGPPFATGLPHYGHIAAGTIKDVVTRYWTQNGKYVERRFGWDCHGLPIECKINEMLGIKTKKDLLALGIEKYNAECRKIVMQYSKDWEWYTRRFGRWIDFQNDYKTLDLNFMESVWWVFKQIYEKGLVYRKCKVMPYSAACNTVLSNFEAGLNYKDLNDPSVIVTFPSVEDPNVKFLAWTTTPWTLPSNLFLAVNPKFDYVHIKTHHDAHEYILAECLLISVAAKLNIEGKYDIVKKMKGSELHGKEYIPLFEEFFQYKERGCFRVYSADYVTSEDGTGIVHNAPGFGEADYMVGVQYNLVDADNPLCPIDDDGMFTNVFPLVAGKHFKQADPIIIQELKSKQRLVFNGTISHPYPCCYRTETPLMYRAVPSWFIKVENLKENLLENNMKSSWVPKYVQEKRFHNWLADAKDWCVSRNRCWGNPIPIWVSEDFEEKVCIGSIKELEELSGCKITDLHREFIDHITIPSKSGKGVLRRIDEVFDCWFESGSMPYAQLHYPFSMSEEEFEKRFPADFIAEGLDQTRGWFYTLNVISTALFNKNPYKNLIVNGLVLAENGKKLSKKDGNFKDPKIIFEQFGADATRLYLINSPLVRGQSLRFSEKGLKEVIKDVFLPLFNSYRFLIQNIQRYESSSGNLYKYKFENITKNLDNLNITDRWIIAYSQRLIKYVRNEMENYRLYTVVSELLSFLDKLTNWYIRLNRSRIKGDFGVEDNLNSLNVLFYTMENLIILLSPFTPFVTEHIYQNLKNGIEDYNEDSIHYLQIPTYNESLIDYKIEEIMNNMINVIELGRQLREKKGISLKRPVASIQVINFEKSFLENLKVVENYIIDELNCNEIIYTDDELQYIKISVKPNFEVLYKKCKEISQMMKDEEKENDPELKKEEETAKSEANQIASVIKTLDENEIRELIHTKTIIKSGMTITKDQVIVEKKFHKQFETEKEYCCISNTECGIRINTASNEDLINAYLSRELINRVQKFRKETGIKISDNINVVFETNEPRLSLVCEKFEEAIIKVLKVPFTKTIPEGYAFHAGSEFEIPVEIKEEEKAQADKQQCQKLNKEQRKEAAKKKEEVVKIKEPVVKAEKTQAAGITEKIKITIYKKLPNLDL